MKEVNDSSQDKHAQCAHVNTVYLDLLPNEPTLHSPWPHPTLAPWSSEAAQPYTRACEVFVERHLVERVDGLVRVSQQEGVNVALGQELGRLEAVHQVVGHVLHEHRVTA